MNKKNAAMVAVVALAFGVAGMVVGLNRKAAAPATTAPTTTAPAATAAPATTAPGTAGPAGDLYAASMNDAKGTPQALSQWKGKALVVNFWAPWCAPCVQEMPELDQLARDVAGKQIHVIGIGIDSPANIAQFADKFKISYPLYVAGMGGTDLSRKFGNTAGGLPYTVLIGADGRVRKTYLGRLKFDELKADLAAM